MKNLYDIFGRGRKLKKGLGEFGVEIETETKSASDYPRDFFGEGQPKETIHGLKMYWHPRTIPEWVVTEDGSLRDFGREFVFKNPLNYPLAMAALQSWGTAVSAVKFSKDAPATSVHVHMNVTEFTPLELANLLVQLFFFENLLTEFSGTIRRSNTFAKPARCADQSLENVISLFESIDKGKKNAIVFSEQHVKYGVINLATIAAYGSIEVRSFRGTTDYVQIQDWLTILNRIYKFSRVPGLTPFEFYKTYQDIEEEIVDRVFGSDAEKLKCADWRDWLRRNEFYLSNLSTYIQDWSKFGSKYVDEPTPKKNLGQPSDFLNQVSPLPLGNQLYQPWGDTTSPPVEPVTDDVDEFPNFDDDEED
jgi:hypothetical protein